MKVTIYHNPRCGKSRKTLALLRERGIEPEIVEYLRGPLDAGALRGLLAQLGLEPRGLMRRKEAIYKEKGLDDPALSDEALIAAMVAGGGRAALGRPPENALDIL